MPTLPRHLIALALASLCVPSAGCRQGADPPEVVGSDSRLVRAPDAAANPGPGAPEPWPGAADTAVPPPALTTAAAAIGDAPAGGGMQRVSVIDPSGFGQPMPALWVQIPAGWQTSGGVVWNAQAPCGATPGFQWQAQSADGRQRLEMLPPDAWTWDNLGMDLPGGSCPRLPITTVQAYLQSLVERMRPGARVLDYRSRDDLVRTPPMPSDAQTRHWKQGGEMLVAYTGPSGEVRESFLAVVQFSETTMAGVMPGEVRKFISGIAGSPVVATAPAGQLDLAVVTHFANSLQPDPQWQARMNQHNAAITKRGLQGQIERGEIITDTHREIADINQRGWESRNDSGDAMHRATVDGINNVDRYNDPVTGDQVQLDNRYDHAWRANDGTYIQSNDPNLNPQVDLGLEAEQMERSE
ncbi:MAG: hypothetical protein K0M70_12450 [Arenimonas sp.]|uniref:hypothetical protein n=1 Tax=Arenimonas sp. TaxID=1872635 RepID=UPI0025C285E1|nr:hypothetical protein [Arenimonas sp.]MBW8368653.1 hypothetical protein [Arenimonas sp.]